MKRIKTIQFDILRNISSNFFYQAISIYLKKTQVVNRKLSCSVNIAFLKLNLTSCQSHLKSKLLKNLCDDNYLNALENVRNKLEELKIEFVESDLDKLKTFDESDDGFYLSIDRMLPRNLQKFKRCCVATFIDTRATSVKIHALDVVDNLLPTTPFELKFSKETCELTLSIEENSDNKWLEFVLLKKLQSWIESCASQENQEQVESHQLIDSESYNKTYAELKEKYGQNLEEGWKESTDPKKFIYEDIAIASYLIVLWKQKRKESEALQSFVDLGCGNGLLVYILTQEGHRGYGIDLRKRKIWDQFPPETDLREEAIIPSDESLFPDVDWIIGNHSDELSPWVSVIAARSSFNSNYFLLPCCAFEFSGVKYQRKSGKKSQYLSYVDYLMTVSAACGFSDTKLDRLKIPSTKRICLVGTKRSYEEENFKLQCDKIQNFINEANSWQSKGNSDKWSETFTPREKIEAVKNCSKIDKNLSESIANRIFNHILNLNVAFFEDYPGWKKGGELSLPEAVKLVSIDELKILKSECGGLQTLLKNKHQIFHIYGGVIRIRKPKKLSENVVSEKSLKRNVVKTVPCYFYLNHPNSCPIADEDCCYIH